MIFQHGVPRQWIAYLLFISTLIVIYHILTSSYFFSDRYARNKIQELEFKNDILLMKLGLSRKSINDLATNNTMITTYNEQEAIYPSEPPICNSESSLKKCDVIHIGMVCAGYKSSRSVVTVLKSILFYRKHPLHFHFMVDNIAERILKTLFETWDIPNVYVSFYPSRIATPYVKWIPNIHYSGIYGLLKLTLPKVLPKNIKKIIILDTDLTFAANIAELWEYFTRFHNKQAIGLVENQSNWYLRKISYQPWPAIGRGFNTGVILLDLNILKEINWSNLWKNIAEKTLTVYASTRLADQDIFNAVIKRNPGLVYKLPCQWNVQLSDNNLSENCYEKSDVKVIHWNSPRKIDVKVKHVDYFRSFYYKFLEFNGNLLRSSLYDCNSLEVSTKFVDSDQCPEFRKAQNSKWRTHIFIREFNYDPSPDGIDITLVAQLSVDRMEMIEELCKHWEGPMSLTIYATDPDVEQCIDYIENSEVLRDRMNIAYHVVYKEGHFYPVNLLRNVGLKYVNTKYVFLSDIDFLPMFGLYMYLKKTISNMNNDLSKTALLIPAFETQRYRSSFPKSKTELLQMLEAKSLFTFRYHVWAKGHAATNYTRWKTSLSSYKVKWEPDFEPYVVVDRNVPLYDSRFLGFGWNKVSHIMELEAAGYEFVVLPQAFIIHMPHAPSHDIARFRTSPLYRMCLKMLKEEFVMNLKEKYGKEFLNKNIIEAK